MKRSATFTSNLPALPGTTGLHRQRGVALISMLLIFTLITVMASDTALRQYLDIRRTHYVQSDTQARQYALGGEALARQLLNDDLEQDRANNTGDHLLENWARVSRPFETEQGEIQLVIEDLDGRFNLNSLVTVNGETDSQQLEKFQRLLGNLGLNTDLAQNLADWLDRDTRPQGVGTEDQFYLAREIGYRTANRPLADSSELMAIKGFTADTVSTLAPFICSLPMDATSGLNVNTAPAVIIASQLPGIHVDRLMQARPLLDNGFKTVQEFLTHDATAESGLTAEGLTVSSQYFRVWVKASYDERTVYLRSEFRRQPDGDIQLLNRQLDHPANTLATPNPFVPDRSPDQETDFDA